jgi:hypothetical protein
MGQESLLDAPEHDRFTLGRILSSQALRKPSARKLPISTLLTIAHVQKEKSMQTRALVPAFLGYCRAIWTHWKPLLELVLSRLTEQLPAILEQPSNRNPFFHAPWILCCCRKLLSPASFSWGLGIRSPSESDFSAELPDLAGAC